MKRADITVTFSTVVENEEDAEEYFDEVIDNLNRSDYEIKDETVEEVDDNVLSEESREKADIEFKQGSKKIEVMEE